MRTTRTDVAHRRAWEDLNRFFEPQGPPLTDEEKADIEQMPLKTKRRIIAFARRVRRLRGGPA